MRKSGPKIIHTQTQSLHVINSKYTVSVSVLEDNHAEDNMKTSQPTESVLETTKR